MPKLKSCKKTPPKRVFALPDSRTREDGRPQQPDGREWPANLRPRHSRVRRLGIARSPAWRSTAPSSSATVFTLNIGTSRRPPSTFGLPRFGADGGRRCRSPESGTGGGHSPCKGGATHRRSAGKLADARTRPAATRSCAALDTPELPRLRDGRDVDWLRTPPRGAVGPAPRLDRSSGRTTGDCRPGRQGRTHANRPDPDLGEDGCRRVDGGGCNYPWLSLPCHQQDRAAVGDGMSPKVLWNRPGGVGVLGIDELAPHDLRRTCARLCHLAGGELDQIQFLMGHVSIQTTERYLGCKQKLRLAVN